jgi:enamine deaminase RidA (YjgF/YER057c/UK114 family)
MRHMLSLVLLAVVPLAAAQSAKEIVKVGPDLPLPFSPAVKAGGLIYVSGTLATDAQGKVVGEDIHAQTKGALDRIRQVLDAAGSSLGDVVSVQVYLKRAEDFAAMNEVYRTYFEGGPDRLRQDHGGPPELHATASARAAAVRRSFMRRRKAEGPRYDPPARTTVVADLLFGGLIEISAVAVPKGGDRRIVHPQGWQKSPSPYNYAIRTGDTLFLSGLVARDPKTNARIEGDTAAQTRAILENAGEILHAAGMGFEHVASARVFITPAADFQAMNAVYRTYFTGRPDRLRQGYGGPPELHATASAQAAAVRRSFMRRRKAEDLRYDGPPARATVRTGLMAPDNLVEVTLTATTAPRKVIAGTGTTNPNLSPAILAGSRLYLAGMLGVTDETRGDAKAQTRETLARLGRTLKEAGFDWPHVVDGVVYLTDLRNYAAMNEAYREVFTRDFPARATVGAGLVAPDGLVEIMFTAVKP